MRLLSSLALLVICATAAPAQWIAARDSIRDDSNFSFYDRGPYRPGIPRPDSLLGYAIGDKQTQFAWQERTLLAIAEAAKDRVRVEEIGATYEGRPMRIYLISAPENIQRLDAIRADLDRLADPRTLSATDRDALIARTPAVVMINESVHGNESPGFEAGMQTLYQLAASEEPATMNALRNTIVVLNPSTNPDGHERFAVWYNSMLVGSPEPFALEHQEPWSIQGRFNHYRFDMNRDVMTTTQREAQALVRAMVRWHPMVAIDQHGQTTNYFFPPTAAPLNPNLGADFEKWMDIYGRGNAAAFDKYGWMYYSRDVFDFYGSFYWDTWPSLTGAIGMTYETDGGGWKGVLWRRDDGSLLSFRDGIAKHYVSAMATIQTTAERKAERVRDYVAFRQAAVDAGRAGPMRRVVLVPGKDPARTSELVATLLRSGIEVRRASGAFTSPRAHAYADDAVGSRRFDSGVYVVDLAQPQGRLARAYLDPSPAIDSAFGRKQVEKYQRNIRRGANVDREGYEFYDVTAWSLPVTFGVDAYWTEDAGAAPGELLSLPAAQPVMPHARQAVHTVGGEPYVVDVPGGIIAGRGARSAYLFAPDGSGALRLAYDLMAEGFRVAVASTPTDAGGKVWPRGTFIVRVARNDSSLAARMDALARESGVEVTGVNTAFTDAGQYGIGSESVVPLEEPKIALVGDEGVSQPGYGAIWWSLERRYGIRFTPVSLRWLASGDLSRFNAIIIPDAFGGAIDRAINKDAVDRLRGWVRNGGVLVTMGGASGWAARESVGLTSARAVGGGDEKDSTGIVTPKSDSALLAVTSPSANNAAPQYLPGSHFDVVLDRTHWLTFGYDRPRVTVMLDGDTFLKLSKEGANVGVFPSTGKLHRAGWAWPENTERLLRGTAYLIDEPVGGGHVVLFTNEPMFRGWWRSLDKLVLNAVLLGPSF